MKQREERNDREKERKLLRREEKADGIEEKKCHEFLFITKKKYIYYIKKNKTLFQKLHPPHITYKISITK